MAGDKQRSQYLHAVAANLKCPAKIRKSILNMISNDISNALDKGLVSTEDIQSEFGDPKDIAEAYLKNLEQGELIKAIKRRKTRIILSVIAAVVVILIGIYMWYYLSMNWQHGKYVYNGQVVYTSSSK